jgi:hypothetical protein
MMELVVFVGALVALGVTSYFFGADTRVWSTVRTDEISRWSR